MFQFVKVLGLTLFSYNKNKTQKNQSQTFLIFFQHARPTRGGAPTAQLKLLLLRTLLKKMVLMKELKKAKTYAEKVSASVKIAEASRIGVFMAPFPPKTWLQSPPE